MRFSSVSANGLALARMAVTRRAAGGAAVMGYHDVRADGAPDTEHYTVSAGQLRAHIDTLRRAGMEIVPLGTIVDRLLAGRPVDGLAALTFDDALVGVHHHALDVLRATGAPATIFVVADALGVAPPWWPGAERTMTVDELREATAAGVELHSHSSVHASLPTLDAPALHTDLSHSRAVLHDTFGVAADLLAYPSGHHDAKVRRVAADAGFRGAVTFLNGRLQAGDDRFRIPRFTAHAGMTAVTLARHLARKPATWPDHQRDVPADERAPT